jgi:DNA-binding MarR family transcriptional regulator
MRALWALDHALHRRSKRMAALLGVTGPQRLVIRLAGEHPSSTAGELAQALHLHPSTLTGVLARLERAGLLRRTTDAGDRRQSRFVLTAAGRALDARTAGTVEAAIERALDQATMGDVDAATRLLATITGMLERQPTAVRPPRAKSAGA